MWHRFERALGLSSAAMTATLPSNRRHQRSKHRSFTTLTRNSSQQDNTAAEAEHRLNADPNISVAHDWLDQHAGWEPGTARRDVAARLSRIDVHQPQNRSTRRGQVDRRQIAEVLSTYSRDRDLHTRPVPR